MLLTDFRRRTKNHIMWFVQDPLPFFYIPHHLLCAACTIMLPFGMRSEICVLRKTFHLKREQEPPHLRFQLDFRHRASAFRGRTWHKWISSIMHSRTWFKHQIAVWVQPLPASCLLLTILKLISAGLAMSVGLGRVADMHAISASRQLRRAVCWAVKEV